VLNPLSTACCWAVAFYVADSVFQEMRLSSLLLTMLGLLQDHGLLVVLFQCNTTWKYDYCCNILDLLKKIYSGISFSVCVSAFACTRCIRQQTCVES